MSPQPGAPAARSWIPPLVAVLLVLGTAARLATAPVQTSDYVYFFRPWFDTLREHAGLSALATPFSDYAPLYLYALKALSVLPVGSLWSIKALSTCGDVALAALVATMLRRSFALPASAALLCFAVLFALPTIVLNSGAWGQIDALYTVAIVACLWCIVEDRPNAAAICFALALCLKLQPIFFAPVLGGYLLRRRRVLAVLWIPAIFALSCLPALLAGASLDNSLLIYRRQTGTYNALTMLAPSVFAFLAPYLWSPSRQTIGLVAGLLAAAACALCTTWWMWRRPARPGHDLLLALWCVTAVPFFLPRMHERYFFMADVLSVAYAALDPRRAALPVLIVGASFLAYVHYLADYVPALAPLVIDLRLPASMMLAALLLLAGVDLPRLRKRSGASAVDEGAPAHPHWRERVG